MATIEFVKECGVYLCYDIKGIQHFIFSVPKLKCIIGASGLIVAFDQEAEDLAKVPEAATEKIFAAGGRGVFFCHHEKAAEEFEAKLVETAWASGLDLRIGVDPDISQALNRADRLYPYTPELPTDDTGNIEPCSMSGLWPVKANSGKGKNRDVHPLIWKRVEVSGDDPLGRFILKELKKDHLIPDALHGFELEFFKNVSPDPEDTAADAEAAKVAQTALGDRNRWAVVLMDGNDMGRQFLEFQRLNNAADQTPTLFQKMSHELEGCTQTAFISALGHAIEQWVSDIVSHKDGIERYCVGENRLILPFRPLVLGGDDVTLLCHPTYAMSFVQNMARIFRDESKNADVEPRWPATGGELTMSAGILYTKVTFPLHMAIPYAESLLSSAKNKFRVVPNGQDADQKKLTPAAVDWDTITDTLVDTPEARRNRELCFEDGELGIQIQLTRRPYLLEPDGTAPDLATLFKLKSKLKTANLAPSVLARILPSLRQPWSERVAFVASVAKRHPILMEQLWEDNPLGESWNKIDDKTRGTGLPDALLLLEEEHRMTQTTTDN